MKCTNCGWKWEIEIEDDRPTLCHKCGWDSELSAFDRPALNQWKKENPEAFNESFDRSSPLKQKLIDQYPREIEKLHITETAMGTIEIGLIRIYSRFQGKGVASDIMKQVIDYADSTNRVVHLTPTDEWGSDKKRLTEFYSTFGFVKNAGSNKDYRIKDTMLRTPKGVTESVMEILPTFQEFIKRLN